MFNNDNFFSDPFFVFETTTPYIADKDKFLSYRKSLVDELIHGKKSQVINKTIKNNKDGTTTLFVEVPGFNKTNLTVKIVGRELQIVGNREDGYALNYCNEMGINETVQHAVLKDGLLTLTIKKKQPEEIQIEIE